MGYDVGHLQNVNESVAQKITIVISSIIASLFKTLGICPIVEPARDHAAVPIPDEAASAEGGDPSRGSGKRTDCLHCRDSRMIGRRGLGRLPGRGFHCAELVMPDLYSSRGASEE